MGSSRSAKYCRLPRRRITGTRRGKPIRIYGQRGLRPTRMWAAKSAGSGIKISRPYGARKVWLQLRREGKAVARCTVGRLMGKLGLKGVVRGKRVKTTISRADDIYPLDRVKRQFNAPRPNALWVADFSVPQQAA